MRLGGLCGVMVRMMIVPGRQVRVMSGLEMRPRLVVLGGLPVMSSRKLVMFGCLVVVLSGCFRHTFHQFRSCGTVARAPHDEKRPVDRTVVVLRCANGRRKTLARTLAPRSDGVVTNVRHRRQLSGDVVAILVLLRQFKQRAFLGRSQPGRRHGGLRALDVDILADQADMLDATAGRDRASDSIKRDGLPSAA